MQHEQTVLIRTPPDGTLSWNGWQMIPWLTRVPTIAEVRAHAEAHPAKWPYNDPGWCVWLAFDGVPSYQLLSADDEGVWLPDGDMLTERRCPGTKWLQCNADGLALCLLGPPSDEDASTPIRRAFGLPPKESAAPEPPPYSPQGFGAYLRAREGT